MSVKMICWFYVVLIGVRVSSETSCDSGHSFVSEGNVGETKTFPWLGVLRVHLHEDTSLKIALTGIVLIKEGYAISSADDVAKIPKYVLKQDSKVMFLPHDKQPWYCKVLDYMTHPEYEYETMNTIALLELDAGENKYYPMKPICWSSYSYNASNQLFAVGFTDEHQFLEKSIHKLQYVEKNLCREFYNRAGLSEGKRTPMYYQCGFAPNNKNDCVWENGMALVSNSTGYWTLIGLGLHGPGCAAPARFIDLIHYYPWIESASNLQEIDEDAYRRKSAFGQGFKRKQKESIEDIPLHELIQSGSAIRRIGGNFNSKLSFFKKHSFSHYYPSSPFVIQHINKSEIIIQSNIGKGGTCTASQEVVYKDYIDVRAPPPTHAPPGHPRKGYVTYKMSLFDLYYFNYTCVRIQVHSMEPKEANIFYGSDTFDIRESASSVESQIIHRYPFTRRSGLDTAGSVPDVNIYLKIYYENEGKIEITIYGHKSHRHVFKKNPSTTTEEPESDTEIIPPIIPETFEVPDNKTEIVSNILRGKPTTRKSVPLEVTRKPTIKENEGKAFLLKSIEAADENPAVHL